MKYTYIIYVYYSPCSICRFTYSNIFNLKILYDQKYDYIEIHMIGMQYTHIVCVFMYNHIRRFIYNNISETILLYNQNMIIL